MDIEQGSVHWIDLGEPIGSGPGYRRPCVVIQNNLFSQSALRTVVICLLTSNLYYANAPGNVVLQPEETNLPKPSVANITQIATVDRDELEEKLATLSQRRVMQIIQGVALLLDPQEV